MKIKRTFHPVGQGAFYSEVHINESEKFTIVYDCGTISKNRKDILIKNIESLAKEGDVIDILFISHFDTDHINGIKQLKERYKIKTVVLPYITKDEKDYLKIKAKIEPNNCGIEILDSGFFDKETKIIFVDPNEQGGVNPTASDTILNIDNIASTRTIPSGTELSSEKSIDNKWLYIPYCHSQEKKYTEFISKLSEKDIDIEKLNDINYVETNFNIIKSIYENMKGEINMTSLMLYSVPSEEQLKLGCLFLGDINLNKVDLSKIKSKYYEKINTLQIPHHGSILNYNDSILDSPSKINSVVCFGERTKDKNYLRKTLAKIRKTSSLEKVTEKKKTITKEYSY